MWSKSFLLNDWPGENACLFFKHHRSTVPSQTLQSGQTYLRYYLKPPSPSHIHTQSPRPRESPECCCLSLCIHLPVGLTRKMSSSISFLLFASRNGKRKILNSHLGSTKAKNRVKRPVSPVFFCIFLKDSMMH